MNEQQPVFKFSSQLKEKVLNTGTLKKFKQGDTIINEGLYVKSIPVVISGALKVIRTDEDGNELFLYYIREGESCIVSFFAGMNNATYKIKAIAEEPTEIVFIPNEKITLLLKDYPEFLEYIFKLYHRRFEELLKIVNDVAFKKMDERLYSLLLQKKGLQGDAQINITHEQLANELGTARVVVSRLLKQLENEKKVDLSRNKITLL